MQYAAIVSSQANVASGDSEAAGIMLKSIYGYTINLEGTDPIISIVERAIADALVAGQPRAWLVDAVPACT